MKSIKTISHALKLLIYFTLVYQIQFSSSMGFAQPIEFSGFISNYKAQTITDYFAPDINTKFQKLHVQIAKSNESKIAMDQKLAPCQTLEIRVASQQDKNIKFKEGVGSIFKWNQEPNKLFLLTAAHITQNQKAMIGVCQEKFYSLKLVAQDFTIDTAVLELIYNEKTSDLKLSGTKDLEPLFEYKPLQSPAYIELEKVTEKSNDYWHELGPLVMDTLNSGIINSEFKFYLQNAKNYSNNEFSPLQAFDRRFLIQQSKESSLIADKTILFSGSEWIYKLTHKGVKPGMSGSPVFYYQKSGLPQTSWKSEYSPEIIMVGIVSKTKINDTQSALIPFNIIFKNLNQLLRGQSNTTVITNNNSLIVNNLKFENLAVGEFKNSSDEIKIAEITTENQVSPHLTSSAKANILADPNTDIAPMNRFVTKDFNSDDKSVYKTKSGEMISLEELLKDTKQLGKIKSEFLQNVADGGPGGDWGGSDGDLVPHLTYSNYYNPNEGYLSIYLDPTPHAQSGIRDDQGTFYYGFEPENNFKIIKSIYSIIPYAQKNISSLLKNSGISDPTLAFQKLCKLKSWQKSPNRMYSETLKGFGTQFSDSMRTTFYSYANTDDKITVYCNDDVIILETHFPHLQLSLTITPQSIQGEIQLPGCLSKIDNESQNVWERNISNDHFDGILEIGDGTEFLIKLNFFKIKKSCSQDKSDEAFWSPQNILTSVVFK